MPDSFSMPRVSMNSKRSRFKPLDTSCKSCNSRHSCWSMQLEGVIVWSTQQPSEMREQLVSLIRGHSCNEGSQWHLQIKVIGWEGQQVMSQGRYTTPQPSKTRGQRWDVTIEVLNTSNYKQITMGQVKDATTARYDWNKLEEECATLKMVGLLCISQDGQW